MTFVILFACSAAQPGFVLAFFGIAASQSAGSVEFDEVASLLIDSAFAGMSAMATATTMLQ